MNQDKKTVFGNLIIYFGLFSLFTSVVSDTSMGTIYPPESSLAVGNDFFNVSQPTLSTFV